MPPTVQTRTKWYLAGYETPDPRYQGGLEDYTADSGQLLTFTYADADGTPLNFIGEGRIVVDDVTAETINARIAFQYVDDGTSDSIAGAFVATRCDTVTDAQ